MKGYSSKEIINMLQSEGYEITTRTFKYYASEKKVLPPTVLIDNKMRYTELHIDYLKAILTLKEKGNTLIEIKYQLDNLSEDEIKLLSTVYKPFKSENMIMDTKNLYQSISTSTDNSLNIDSGVYNTMNYANSISSSYSISNNTSFVSSPITHNSISSSQSSIQTKETISDIGFETEINTSNKKKRTILNKDIIIETKNVSNECLNEMLDSIEKIYKKYNKGAK